MKPLLESPKPTSQEADLEFLNLQVHVGSIMLANPGIIRYIELQTEMLMCELSGFNQDPNGDAVRFKDAVLMRTQQIAVYKHLHDLASKHKEMQAAYEALRIQN